MKSITIGAIFIDVIHAGIPHMGLKGSMAFRALANGDNGRNKTELPPNGASVLSALPRHRRFGATGLPTVCMGGVWVAYQNIASAITMAGTGT